LFPCLGERVASLYDRDDVFHELCDDYSICLGAVNRTEVSGSPRLRAEYAALQLRLEAELLNSWRSSAPARRRRMIRATAAARRG
jgi:hypothetical protein